MKITMRLAAAFSVFLSAALLQAGAQCHLLGTVTDSSGAPIADVAVTITTPSLRTFKLTIKTDAKGNYSTLLNDCTMPYHVAFDKEGSPRRARTRRFRSTTRASWTRNS